MLPISLFRQPEEKARIISGLKKKNFAHPEYVEEIITLDENKRKVQQES